MNLFSPSALTQPEATSATSTLAPSSETIKAKANHETFSLELNKHTKPYKKNAFVQDPAFPETPKNEKGLHLAGKNIGDKGMSVIANQWQHQHGISALFLSQNNLGAPSTQLLLQMLAHNQTVKHLILSGNQISDFAMAGLADLLKVNHFIGWVVLNKNGITSDGAIELAEAVKKNKGIIHLILSDNEIGDRGAIALSQALSDHPKIKSLFLKGNPIGEKGVNAIINLMKTSKTLNKVDLRSISPLSSATIYDLKMTAKENNVDLLFDQ